MSIPLVQNNEKDAINTSIIAIKRNIERINMLLGLSNSEEIDTSKFATKDELQQAVTDLQPVDEVALDNMHSVTSNAVAKAISYISSEVNTGKKWIDGKPIYRITLKNVASDIGRDVDVVLSSILVDKNVDTLVELRGYVNFIEHSLIEPMPSTYLRLFYETSDKYIYIRNNLSSSTTNNVVMLIAEYTKTTD